MMEGTDYPSLADKAGFSLLSISKRSIPIAVQYCRNETFKMKRQGMRTSFLPAAIVISGLSL
jgi:hypothetical protein